MGILNKIGYRLRTARAVVRSYTTRRMHIVNIANKDYGYTRGWADTDTRMMLACFKLFTDYVENEHPFEVTSWDWNEDHKRVAEEIKTLYSWWTKGRKEEHDALEELGNMLPQDRMLDSPMWKEYCRGMDAAEAKDNEMFERLMKIRHYLWT
jgi:hypothetical protein